MFLKFYLETDPIDIVMVAESYALLSEEYAWIKHMRSNYKNIPVKYFPNFLR